MREPRRPNPKQTGALIKKGHHMEQTATDATLRAKALARWENEGGAPVGESAEKARSQARPANGEPEPRAREHWQ